MYLSVLRMPRSLMSINSWIYKAWALGQWKTANQWRLPVQAKTLSLSKTMLNWSTLKTFLKNSGQWAQNVFFKSKNPEKLGFRFFIFKSDFFLFHVKLCKFINMNSLDL